MKRIAVVLSCTSCYCARDFVTEIKFGETTGDQFKWLTNFVNFLNSILKMLNALHLFQTISLATSSFVSTALLLASEDVFNWEFDSALWLSFEYSLFLLTPFFQVGGLRGSEYSFSRWKTAFLFLDCCRWRCGNVPYIFLHEQDFRERFCPTKTPDHFQHIHCGIVKGDETSMLGLFVRFAGNVAETLQLNQARIFH